MPPEVTASRLVALSISAAVAIFVHTQRSALHVSPFFILPLVLIWFSELLGSATGFIGHSRVNTQTPAWLVSGFGWAVLLLFSGLVLFDYSPPPGRISSVARTNPLPVTSRSNFATADEAQREAVRRYPALGIAGSELNREFVARYRACQQQRPDLFRDTSWPLQLAEELMRERQ